MSEEASRLTEEAIRLEQNMVELYRLFHNLFPEDADFWWKMVIEESNHAVILQSGKDYYLPEGEFPVELLPQSIKDLEAANARITSLIHKYHDDPPTRQQAFTTALELEQSAGEIHFQDYIGQETDCKLHQIFRQLTGDDKDHADRIQAYMEAQNFQ